MTDSPSADRATDALATPGVLLSARQIQNLIPHRWPILMVDRIVEYDADAKRKIGRAHV